MTSTIEKLSAEQRLRAAAEQIRPLPEVHGQSEQTKQRPWFMPVPAHINFDALGIDVDTAVRRFEVARRGREMLPELAALKRDALEVGIDADGPADAGDDTCELVFALMGVTALTEVLVEIGWIGGWADGHKIDDITAAVLDAYTAENIYDPDSEYAKEYANERPISRAEILDELEKVHGIVEGLERAVGIWGGPPLTDDEERAAWKARIEEVGQ